MDLELLSFLVLALLIVYVLGILTHKYAINQSETIKAHVTAEIQEVRADVAELVKKFAARL
jgi:hypothetical protein